MPKGNVIELGLSVAALPLPDGSRGYLYTFQDVTDVKRFEQNARLQQRLAAVGEMAAGIAHEIRNPLASMSGSMQMLKQELPLSADQAQLMDIVLKESERLNQTIKSFLAYARPQRFSLQKLDLRPIVAGDRDAAAQQHRSRGAARGRSEASRRRRSWSRPTKSQIRQIHLEPRDQRLARDAERRHAVPERGPREDAGRTASAVLLVEDEGVGIPPEDVDTIFQPFRGSFGKGTGLGLAIVHRIVTDYGGHIDVRPRPAGGTVVPRQLPRARGRAAERQAS